MFRIDHLVSNYATIRFDARRQNPWRQATISGLTFELRWAREETKL